MFAHKDWKEYSPSFAKCSYTWPFPSQPEALLQNRERKALAQPAPALLITTVMLIQKIKN